jgi:hypothetical protein
MYSNSGAWADPATSVRNCTEVTVNPKTTLSLIEPKSSAHLIGMSMQYRVDMTAERRHETKEQEPGEKVESYHKKKHVR